MKQLFCRTATPELSDGEACIRAATHGHLCPASGCHIPADILAIITAPSISHLQTGTAATAISASKPEAGQL